MDSKGLFQAREGHWLTPANKASRVPPSDPYSAARLYQVSLLEAPHAVNESPEANKVVFVSLRSAICPIYEPSRLVQKYTHLTVLELSRSSAVLYMDSLRLALGEGKLGPSITSMEN